MRRGPQHTETHPALTRRPSRWCSPCWRKGRTQPVAYRGSPPGYRSACGRTDIWLGERQSGRRAKKRVISRYSSSKTKVHNSLFTPISTTSGATYQAKLYSGSWPSYCAALPLDTPVAPLAPLLSARWLTGDSRNVSRPTGGAGSTAGIVRVQRVVWVSKRTRIQKHRGKIVWFAAPRTISKRGAPLEPLVGHHSNPEAQPHDLRSDVCASNITPPATRKIA